MVRVVGCGVCQLVIQRQQSTGGSSSDGTLQDLGKKTSTARKSTSKPCQSKSSMTADDPKSGGEF